MVKSMVLEKSPSDKLCCHTRSCRNGSFFSFMPGEEKEKNKKKLKKVERAAEGRGEVASPPASRAEDE